MAIFIRSSLLPNSANSISLFIWPKTELRKEFIISAVLESLLISLLSLFVNGSAYALIFLLLGAVVKYLITPFHVFGQISSLFLLAVLILLLGILRDFIPFWGRSRGRSRFWGLLIRRYYKCKYKCTYLGQNRKMIMKNNIDFLS